jgi:hypothetical protein
MVPDHFSDDEVEELLGEGRVELPAWSDTRIAAGRGR